MCTDHAHVGSVARVVFGTKFRASTLPALATSRAGRAIAMRYLRLYSFVPSSQWGDDYAPLADNPATLFPPVRFRAPCIVGVSCYLALLTRMLTFSRIRDTALIEGDALPNGEVWNKERRLVHVGRREVSLGNLHDALVP